MVRCQPVASAGSLQAATKVLERFADSGYSAIFYISGAPGSIGRRSGENDRQPLKDTTLAALSGQKLVFEVRSVRHEKVEGPGKSEKITNSSAGSSGDEHLASFFPTRHKTA
jgi:hypothetical protein